MTALSKLTSSLDYNCYEIAHPWTPSCTYAWSYLFLASLRESGKVYGALYLFAQLVLARKISIGAFVQTLQSAARSSVFLSYNAFFFLFFICMIRRSTPRLFLQQTVFVAGFLASFLSIFIERPNRRKMLSVYMLNIFSEVLFNFLSSRGFIPSVPGGDILLLAAGLAGHAYLLNESSGKDPISKALSFLIGKQEFHSAAPRACPHPNACAGYVTSGFVKPFLVGYLGRCALSAFAGNPVRLLKNPSQLLEIFLNRNNAKQGVSLGGMVASFRLIRCLLRKRKADDQLSRAAAMFVSASWMGVSRNRSLSLYVFWKAVEVYYLIGQSQKILPDVPFSRELIYALSCGFMLFSGVLEPHNLRSSYLRFLDKLTGEGVSRVNRHPVAVLGFDSTRSWPDYFPYDLDISKVSRGFLQRVVIWS
ncbi:transmembrane protein 135 [Galendromus occidentalis]|uniref:Transmembrane protein 135 n=1 Tax=Galendromus occidentalis TaxID=34638 RepID=A0AAJ6QLZ3_9ACAR|nr:transmembrane protein 135 [Galendromus occidentalis]